MSGALRRGVWNTLEASPSHALEGIFPIYKPRLGCSNRCLLNLKKALGFPITLKHGRPNARAFRMGHGGTLDALASGVLVVGIGKGCSELQSYLTGSKSYIVKAQLGARTRSLDLGTPCEVTSDWRNVTKDMVLALLPKYRGLISQKTPMYSAKSVKGERLYKLALDGQDVERAEKLLNVFHLELLAFEPPYFSLAIESSSGFYVRQLVADVGDDLGCGAVAFSITRTRHGPFEVKDALREHDWTREKIAEKIAASQRLTKQKQ